MVFDDTYLLISAGKDYYCPLTGAATTLGLLDFFNLSLSLSLRRLSLSLRSLIPFRLHD